MPTKPETIEPTVPMRIRKPSENFRRGVNWRLRHYFQEFLKTATAEEKHFMVEVFSNWESASAGQGPEICIASAFADEFNGRFLTVLPSDVYIEMHKRLRELEEFQSKLRFMPSTTESTAA